MLKGHLFRSKLLILGVLASMSILFFPYEALGQVDAGSLTGFIYWESQKSPMEGAIVKLRNVLTDTIYQSEPSDKNGMYVIKEITAGSYVLGVSTQQGNFNFDRELQIKALELAKLNLVLKVDKNGILVAGALGAVGAGAAVAGAAAAVGFFATPVGIAVAVVAAVAVTAATVSLLSPSGAASPARR
ncbi:MAG: carboxypeptidase-like regulatory domain-containing protein [Candidatus Aminicenantales bacterium]